MTFTIAVLIMVGSYMAGCFTTTMNVVQRVDIYEPNDVSAQAYSFGGVGKHEFTALISPAGDQDWFSINAEDGATINLNLLNLPADYNIYLYDLSMSLISSSTNTGTASETLTFPVTATGEYHFLVSAASPDTDLLKFYTCQANVTAANGSYDEYEMNDTRAAATALGGSDTISAEALIFTLSGTDEDWFSFQISNDDCMLQVHLGQLPADYDLELYNSGGTLIGTSNNTGTTSESIDMMVCHSGTYYVRIYAPGGASDPDNYYHLDIRQTCYEPNNTRSMAYNLGAFSGISLQAFIKDNSDEDYYMFTAVANADVTINLTSLPADYDVYLLDSSGGLLKSSTFSGTIDEQIQTVLSSGGTFYVRVVGATSSDYSDTSTYRIQVIKTGGSGPTDYEPNDSIAEAYNLGGGNIYNLDAYIEHASDQDYYSVNVSTAGNVYINLTNLPNDYDLALYNSTGTAVAYSNNWGTASESISYYVSSGAVGIYYIQVYPWSGFSSTEPYHLNYHR